MKTLISIIVAILILVGLYVWLKGGSSQNQTAMISPTASESPMASPTPTPVPTNEPNAVLDITAQHNGATLTYTPTTPFMLSLDETVYPSASLKRTCTPTDALTKVTVNLPVVASPSYAFAYIAAKAGTCTFTDKDFSVTVKVVKAASPSPSAMPQTSVKPSPSTTSGY